MTTLSSLDLWETLGEIPEDELPHVMTKLFVTYEAMLENEQNKEEALNFFNNLSNAITQTNECNLNRR